MFGHYKILILLNRVWLVVWLTVLPLVHIHPEIDHAHGASDHVHGGQYHSVLSEDLSCEFHGHSHSASPDHTGSPSGSLHSFHSSGHVLNHAEIGFSLLTKKGDDQLVSPAQAESFTLSDSQSILIIHSRAQTISSRGSPPNWLVVPQHRVRPPPVGSTHSI